MEVTGGGSKEPGPSLRPEWARATLDRIANEGLKRIRWEEADNKSGSPPKSPESESETGTTTPASKRPRTGQATQHGPGCQHESICLQHNGPKKTTNVARVKSESRKIKLKLAREVEKIEKFAKVRNKCATTNVGGRDDVVVVATDGSNDTLTSENVAATPIAALATQAMATLHGTGPGAAGVGAATLDLGEIKVQPSIVKSQGHPPQSQQTFGQEGRKGLEAATPTAALATCAMATLHGTGPGAAKVGAAPLVLVLDTGQDVDNNNPGCMGQDPVGQHHPTQSIDPGPSDVQVPDKPRESRPRQRPVHNFGAQDVRLKNRARKGSLKDPVTPGQGPHGRLPGTRHLSAPRVESLRGSMRGWLRKSSSSPTQGQPAMRPLGCREDGRYGSRSKNEEANEKEKEGREEEEEE